MKNIHFNTMLSECSYCVTDIETGSVSKDGKTGIIEIAGVRINTNFIIDLPGAFTSLINPQKPIEPAATAIHGITDEIVANAPDEKTVMAEFACYMDGCIFVAHNAPFDKGYIERALRFNKIPSPINYTIDTLTISRRLLPNLPSHSLDALINYYGLTTPRPGGMRHRALYDADLTAMLFIKQIEHLNEYGVYTFGDICSFINGGIY